MKTYTIVATDTREKLDNTWISQQFCISADADISLSHLAVPGTTDLVELRAGIAASFNLSNPEIYVKGTLGDKISIFNGVISLGSLAVV